MGEASSRLHSIVNRSICLGGSQKYRTDTKTSNLRIRVCIRHHPRKIRLFEIRYLDHLLLAVGMLVVADDAEVLVASGSDDSVLGLVLHVLGEAVAQWPSF